MRKKDDTEFFIVRLDRRTKQKLRTLAEKSEGNMSYAVRKLIKREYKARFGN